MKWLSPGLAVLLIVAGALWFRQYNKSVEYRLQAEARADSITVVIAQHDSSYAVQDSVRAILLDSVAALEGQAATMRGNMAAARTESDSLVSALGVRLYADSTISDSTRSAIDHAVGALQTQVRECVGLVDNCEQRVDLLARQLATDTLLLMEARAQTRYYAEQYQSEILKRQPKKFTVGVMIGYGATLSKGQVYAGPSITLGVSIRLFSF